MESGILLTPPVKVKVTYPDVVLPKYAYEGDAGFDLSVYLKPELRAEGFTIFPGERQMLETGLSFELPFGFWGSIQHRSSTEKRYRLRVVQGTIDSNYTGPLYVQVCNDNSYPIHIAHNDRLAQMILHRVTHPTEFVVVDELRVTDRGSKGFGSTGK